MIKYLNDDVSELMESLEEQRATITLCRESIKDLCVQRREVLQRIEELPADNQNLKDENVDLIEKLKIDNPRTHKAKNKKKGKKRKTSRWKMMGKT